MLDGFHGNGNQSWGTSNLQLWNKHFPYIFLLQGIVIQVLPFITCNEVNILYFLERVCDNDWKL